MKTKDFITSGTCARAIHVEVDDDGIVRDVRFDKGCSGNTQGVSRLAVGRPAAEVADILRGIRCGFKPTSCPDQLAKALDEMIAE